MQCTKCKDFNACMDCYFAHVHYKRHKPNHNYYPRADFDFVIWQDGFTLHDDLTLIEGIEVCGFGSWENIKSYM